MWHFVTVTPETFEEFQLESLKKFLDEGEFINDDQLEDIVLSECFREYVWTERDTEFTQIVRTENVDEAHKLALIFLWKYLK